MGIGQKFWTLVDRMQRRGAETAERAARDRRIVDAVLAGALGRAEAAGPLYYPIHYLQFLRDCTEGARIAWREVRSDPEPAGDPAGNRFAAMAMALADLPAVELASAEHLARVADALRASVNPATGEREHGDQQRLFSLGASLGVKGRVLHTIVRAMRSTRVVELGTFWGMSAMFLLEALETAGPEAHLTTVELTKLWYAKASALLNARYPGRVSCILGRTKDVVPDLGRTLTGIDLLFHDAGHSREDYVGDFTAALPFLAPGSVVLFDDIRWNDPQFVKTDPRCYEGWMEVTRHPRVRRAGEIGAEMGVVLLR